MLATATETSQIARVNQDQSKSLSRLAEYGISLGARGACQGEWLESLPRNVARPNLLGGGALCG